MARTRQIFQSDQLYISPIGPRACNSPHSSESVSGNILSAISGDNFSQQLFRIQSINYNYSKTLTDVNQFGELASIDRIPLTPPTVDLTFSYLLSNFINEGLIGLTVNQSGDSAQVSCISGILNNQTDSKNYFIKTVNEGNDVANNAQNPYNVISLGNCYLNSYTSQGAVNSFPTVDINVLALNIQGQSVNQLSGAMIPAIDPINGTQIQYGYILPTGTQNYNGLSINSSNESESVIRPGQISLSLGLGEGDSFFQESDLKIQSYNISINLNREDISALGSKYYIKKVPNFPIEATMSVEAVVGQFVTGNLVQIINDNKSFNPTVTLKRNSNNNIIGQYQLRGAKLLNQDIVSQIGANKLVTFNFSASVGSSQSNVGLFMSGVTFNNYNTIEDWGSIADSVDSSEDWGAIVADPVTVSENWGSII